MSVRLGVAASILGSSLAPEDGRRGRGLLSGNATFDSTSDHDYSVAPEPSGVLLGAVGSLVLAGARRRDPRR